MLTVAEAQDIITHSIPTAAAITVPLQQAHNKILRQDLLADRPLPPFHRSMMDGIAIDSQHLPQPSFSLSAKVQLAGSPPLVLESKDQAIAIMTGAPLPEGCDTVIPCEHYQQNGDSLLLLAEHSPQAGQYIHALGSDYPAGATLLSSGQPLHSHTIPIAASAGYHQLAVAPTPHIAIISSGDELVAPQDTPLPYQIRRSNPYALEAALLAHGFDRYQSFHLADDPQQTQDLLQRCLQDFDILLISGGISKGKKDHIASSLPQLGIETHFQWVAQRPGKPLLFASHPDSQSHIFALPGNPLSTLTCFHQYVLPALRQYQGAQRKTPLMASLASDFHFPPPLAYFLPVTIRSDAQGLLLAQPQPAQNSGDYASIAATDGFVLLDGTQQNHFPTGTPTPFTPW